MAIFFSTPEMTPTKQQSEQSTHDSTHVQSKKMIADHQQKKHAFPEQQYDRHSSQSPSYNLPFSKTHLDPIDQQSPICGAKTEDESPTTPTSSLYNKDNEALVSLSEEEEKPRTDGRSRKYCDCCSIM